VTAVALEQHGTIRDGGVDVATGRQATLGERFVIEPETEKGTVGGRSRSRFAETLLEIGDVPRLFEGDPGERRRIGDGMHVGIPETGDENRARESLLDQSGFPEVRSIADRDDPSVFHEHRVPEHAGGGSNCACGDEPGTYRWLLSQRR
jgi:hypothetical protein